MNALSLLRQTVTYDRIARRLGLDPAPLGEEPTMPYERFTKPIAPPDGGEVAGLEIQESAPVDEPTTGGPDVGDGPTQLIRRYVAESHPEPPADAPVIVLVVGNTAHRSGWSDQPPPCWGDGRTGLVRRALSAKWRGDWCQHERCFGGAS